jgi:hypothetical protein
VTIARNRWKTRLFLAAVFVIFASYFGAVAWFQARQNHGMPPPPGDTQDYDNIAVQLMHGRGFAIDYNDPEWRRPYEAANADGTFDEILSRHAPFKTTTRLPLLLPLILATVYTVFGRSFLAWQLVNAVITALGLMVICATTLRAFGSRVALVTAAVMFLSTTYLSYVVYWSILTETLAILLLALFVRNLSRLAAAPRMRTAVACGIVMGLMGLARNFFVLWLPLVTILAAWLVMRAGVPRRGALKLAGTLLVVAIALQLPWWIRNCRVLGAFMPLGTEGGVSLYAGYSDGALKHAHWWNATRMEMRTAFVNEIGHPCPDDDVALARCEAKGTLLWIAHHPKQVPGLIWKRVANTLAGIDEAGRYGTILIASLAAPFVVWRRRAFVDVPTAIIFGAMIVFDLLTIAATWAIGWRFLVPVEPMIAAGAALVLVAAFFGDSAIVRDHSTCSSTN